MGDSLRKHHNPKNIVTISLAGQTFWTLGSFMNTVAVKDCKFENGESEEKVKSYYCTATMWKLPSDIPTYCMRPDTVKSHPPPLQTSFIVLLLFLPCASVCWPLPCLNFQPTLAAAVVMWPFHPELWTSANQSKNSKVCSFTTSPGFTTRHVI